MLLTDDAISRLIFNKNTVHQLSAPSQCFIHTVNSDNNTLVQACPSSLTGEICTYFTSYCRCPCIIQIWLYVMNTSGRKVTEWKSVFSQWASSLNGWSTNNFLKLNEHLTVSNRGIFQNGVSKSCIFCAFFSVVASSLCDWN